MRKLLAAIIASGFVVGPAVAAQSANTDTHHSMHHKATHHKTMHHHTKHHKAANKS